ncbi:MAG: pilus assembly protein, partial [Bdellovibrio bacteriovorus]
FTVGLAWGLDSIPISHAPPYLIKGVPPNLILTLDNSRSMLNAHSWAIEGSPEGAFDVWDYVLDTVSGVNRQYYDPRVTYLPPLGSDGSPFPGAELSNFEQAPRDFGPVVSCTSNLETDYAPLRRDALNLCASGDALYALDLERLTSDFLALLASAPSNLAQRQLFEESVRSQASACLSGADCPAFYYWLQPSCSIAQLDALRVQGTDAERLSWIQGCLLRVEVGSPEDLSIGATRLTERQTLLGADGAADPEVLARRNFVNWYAYHRDRWFTLKTVISRTVSELNPQVRVTYQSLDDDQDLSRLFESFGSFDPERVADFYDWLFNLSVRVDEQTPLVRAAVRVFDFGSDDRSYLEEPQSTGGDSNPVRACRNQFHLIFSDGVWSDGSPPAAWLANNDGTAQGLPLGEGTFAESLGLTGYTESAATTPYWDSNSGGLADVVFHSWITDLRPEEDLVGTLIRDPEVPSGEDPSYVFWNPANDPADWQHITTFTVGLGLVGEVAYPSGDYGVGLNILTNGFPGDWSAFLPGRAPTATERVDDLWHAGVNGRGGHSTAQDPEALLGSFQRVLSTVSESVKADAASAAPASSTGSAGTSRYLFQASLNTSDWTGDVRAFRVSGGLDAEPCPEANKPPGELCEGPGTYYWSAADRLDGNPERGIAPRLWTTRRVVSATASYASDGAKSYDAIDFRSTAWGSLSEADQRALLGLSDAASPLPGSDSLEVQEAQAVMDYIAGKADSDPFEFRVRKSLIGDIIYGAPVVVGPPSRIFNDPDYRAFADANRGRVGIVYAGSNNGLLHAFGLETGSELFAYVPRPLFDKLATLTEPGYGSDPQHTNYVDGPIAEGDAQLGGTGWSSVIVGALGAGAQGVYAIRSPSISSGSDLNAEDVHLWDFTDRDDPDLGYVFGKPAIVRVLMSDGSIRWVAVIGNGYNSSENDGRRAVGCDDSNQDDGVTACGRAVLYVLDIATGRLIAKLDTQAGRSEDPRQPGDVSAREPNGLGQPTVVGRVLTGTDGAPLGGGDLIATVAYAGDLFGNLWRFDLTGLPEGSTAGRATRVFQARGPGGNVQPITAAPALAPHPTGVGTLVLFGTGRYLGQPDVTDLSVQTFYGLWDQGGTGPVSADGLLEQELLQTDLQAVGDGSSIAPTLGRTSTRNPIDWSVNSGWRLDLIGPGGAQGERVVSAAQLRGDRVIFVSLVPEPDPCKAGGFSWVNAVAFATGSALDESPFDFDLNGTFDSADLLDTDDESPVAGTSMRLAAGGIYSSPTALVLPGGETQTLVSGSEGDLVQLRESSALRWRVWHQIQ